MAELVQVEYELHASSTHQEIQRLDKELIDIQNSAEDFDLKLKKALKNRKAYSEAHVNLKRLQTEFGRTGKAAQQAGGLRGIGFFGQQVGYLVSDARYGILGMANNLSIIVPQFQNLQKHAKAAGTSLGKEFLKSLRGPTGILIAMQLLIVLLPEIIDYFKKWSAGATEASLAMKKATLSTIAQEVKLKSLQRALNGVNLSLHDREIILGKLEKQGVKVKGPDGKWLENLDDINDAIKKNIELIRSRAKVRALEELLVEKIKEQSEGPGFGKALYRRILGTLKGQNLGEIALDFVNENEKEINDLTSAIDKEVSKLLGLEDTPDKKSGPSYFERALKQYQDFVTRYDDVSAEDFETNLQTAIRRQEIEQDNLKTALEKKLITQEEYLELNQALEEKYGRLRQDGYEEDERIKRIAEQAKRDQIQATLEKTTQFLVQAAQLNEKNKGLAKAAIIANAAVASIGIWRDYHGEKNTIPTPFNTISAGVAIGSLGIATASAIKSLNGSGSGVGTGSNTNQAPRFNVIGGTGNNQLADVINQQTVDLNNKPIKAFVVSSEIDNQQQLERQAEAQASI